MIEYAGRLPASLTIIWSDSGGNEAAQHLQVRTMGPHSVDVPADVDRVTIVDDTGFAETVASAVRTADP